MPAPPPPVVAPSHPPPVGFFGADQGARAPFHDPFPQVPTGHDFPAAPPPPGGHGGSDDSGFDDLARRFEDLKKRK